MTSLVDSLADTAAKLLLRQGTVRRVHDLAPDFRRLDLQIDGTAPEWEPGCKAQLRLGGRTLRAFTPFTWSGSQVSLLVFRHGSSPANDWIDDLCEGRRVEVLGPRRSLRLDLRRDPILVGDETSVALAAAWHRVGAAPAAEYIFEATTPMHVALACEHLGLGSCTIVERSAGDGHLAELTERVLAGVGRHPDAPLVLTGKLQTIRTVRSSLKESGLSRQVRVKAYWDPQRTGMD